MKRQDILLNISGSDGLARFLVRYRTAAETTETHEVGIWAADAAEAAQEAEIRFGPGEVVAVVRRQLPAAPPPGADIPPAARFINGGFLASEAGEEGHLLGLYE